MRPQAQAKQLEAFRHIFRQPVHGQRALNSGLLTVKPLKIAAVWVASPPLLSSQPCAPAADCCLPLYPTHIADLWHHRGLQLRFFQQRHG